VHRLPLNILSSCDNPQITQIFGNSIQFNITLSMQYLYHINVPPFYFAIMHYTTIPVSTIPGSFFNAFVNLCSLCQAFSRVGWVERNRLGQMKNTIFIQGVTLPGILNSSETVDIVSDHKIIRYAK